jgi:hypothetical protein
MLKALINKDKVKTCKDHEEVKGRTNTDMLNRLVIVGGPFVPVSDAMQAQLVKNVSSV